MKTWLFSLGMFFMSNCIFAQGPMAPGNLFVSLTPTDSLGLYLAGYEVIPQIQFEIGDTMDVSSIFVQVGDSLNNGGILTNQVPYQLATTYFHQGLTVIRSGNLLWIDCENWPYESTYVVEVKVQDSQGQWSSPSTIWLHPGQ